MPQDSSKQRNILIQGASRGIGLEITRQLAERSDTGHVLATCRQPDAASELARLAEADRVTVLRLDLTDEDTIEAAAQLAGTRLDKLDLLVNCAGLLHAGTMQPERRLREVTPEHLTKSFQVNAFGPLLVAKHFESLLGKSPSAVFASISARVGSIGDNRLGGWYSYRASKAAQNMMTKTLAVEWARRPRPITCIALHPGTVATELSEPFRSRTDPSRVFSVERAAGQLITILDETTPEDNGRFIAWDGSSIPW